MYIIWTLYIYIHLFLYDSQQKTYDDKIHLSVIVIHRSGDAEECLNNIRQRERERQLRQIYLSHFIPSHYPDISANINNIICKPALSQTSFTLTKCKYKSISLEGYLLSISSILRKFKTFAEDFLEACCLFSENFVINLVGDGIMWSLESRANILTIPVSFGSQQGPVKPNQSQTFRAVIFIDCSVVLSRAWQGFY